MPDIQDNNRVNLFMSQTVRPLANTLIGTHTAISVGEPTWAEIETILNDAGVGPNDLIIDTEALAGYGSLTRTQLTALVVFIGTLKPTIAAEMPNLSAAHTGITLPR